MSNAAETRSRAWLEWMADVRSQLLLTPGSGQFFAENWSMHAPKIIAINLPAMNWTSDELCERVGDVMVEVQANRLEDANYEIRSEWHKTIMLFRDFVDQMQNGPGNDVYMTANNSNRNIQLLHKLADDLKLLPDMLHPDPTHGFLWIGKDTLTPMHHDLGQILLIQLVGKKNIRLVPPSEQPKLGNNLHVFADFAWLSDELAKSRNIYYMDIELHSGQALFLPVGWWHCVQAEGVSITYTSTNFIWPNNWSAGFP